MFVNILIWAALSAGYFFYLSNYTKLVPEDWALTLNFVLIPLVSGAIAQIVYRGTQGLRIAFTAMIPVIPALLLGGDPKFPGLQVSLAGILAIVFCVGGFISAESIKVIRKMVRSRGSEK